MSSSIELYPNRLVKAGAVVAGGVLGALGYFGVTDVLHLPRHAETVSSAEVATTQQDNPDTSPVVGMLSAAFLGGLFANAFSVKSRKNQTAPQTSEVVQQVSRETSAPLELNPVMIANTGLGSVMQYMPERPAPQSPVESEQ